MCWAKQYFLMEELEKVIKKGLIIITPFYKNYRLIVGAIILEKKNNIIIWVGAQGINKDNRRYIIG